MRRSLPLLLAGTLLLAGCGSADESGLPSAAPVAGFGDQVGAVSCDLGGHDAAYHVHAVLGVTGPDGSRLAVPANIGVGERCMYWVHTHETDVARAQIHVEAPDETTATLADFLEIWRRSANPTIPDAVIDGLATIRADGRAIDDPARIVLVDGLEIEITLRGYPRP